MQNAILYQAYGVDFINECRYSLLKYLEVYNLVPPAATAIVIYTDQPHLFSDFLPFFHDLRCKELTPEIIKHWKGANNFVHRLKVEMIADFLEAFDGNVLYCDTDTYAIKPLEEIFSSIEKDTFYLHQFEGVPDKKTSPSFHKWETFLSTTPVFYNQKKFEFSRTIQLFNAGVVGLNTKNKDVLKDVLGLTDSLFQKFQKHIAEQIAFSYCFQKTGVVKSTDAEIAHYWNLKEFRQLLQVFFTKNLEESIPNLVKKVHHLDALAIQEQKNRFARLPYLQRLFKTISGTRWRITQYEKKL